MISDLDIYRTASVLIREHGEDAAVEAAQRADSRLENGDLEGQAVWKRIILAVEDIQRAELGPGERRHYLRRLSMYNVRFGS